MSLTQGNEKLTIPITLHTTSGSMIPAIRMNVDAVVVVTCELEDVRVGDIVLMRDADSDAGVLLHRLYRARDGKLVTLGDNMRRPDPEKDGGALLGRAVSITGPGKAIDCDSRWSRLRGALIVRGYPLRPFLFRARGAMRRLRGLLCARAR